MMIRDEILKAINKPKIRRRLMEALDCTEQTIRAYIYKQPGCDNLTKAAALKIIREETGLSDDELLTETLITNQ
jgi:hypothetical protein